MKNYLQMIITLSLVCSIAAGALALVNQATKEKIALQAELEKREALKMVFPSASDSREVIKDKQWEAYNGDEKVGVILQNSVQGYSGPIKVLFGLNLNNEITGVKILIHSETPGLGAKITKDSFLEQFNNKNIDELYLKKDNPQKGSIDAIAAATISSKAVTNAIRKTVDLYLKGEYK